MSDTTSPAAESVGASAPESLSLEAAAEMLTRSEETTERPPAEPDADETVTPEETGGDVDTEAEADPEAPAAAEDENNPEDEAIDLDKIHGNSKIRLRDRKTEWTMSEVKRRIDELQALDTHKQTFAQEQQAFREREAQIAQQAQSFEAIAPQWDALLRQALPEIPPEPTFNPDDPLSYIEEKAKWDATVRDYNGKWQQLQQIEQQRAQINHQRQQEQAQHRDRIIQEGAQRLVELVPEFKDRAKAEAFGKDLMHYGTSVWGFAPEDIAGVYDPRVLVMARKAIAYDKLMEAKPKPSQPQQRTQAAAPVSMPGRRVSGQEARQVRREELTSRVSKPGGLSMSEAVALLEQSQKD